MNKIAGKPVKIYAEVIEEEAMNQFKTAMQHEAVIKGALMPDAHTGYSLPIGGVVASKDVIFPAFVGYDIGCGMSAVNLGLKKEEVAKYKDQIFSSIYRIIPTGFNHNREKEKWNFSKIDRTDFLDKLMEQRGLNDLCSLGSGNHFIEISYDEDDNVWIIIHSGSRNVGHTVATKYMKLASVNEKALLTEFEKKSQELSKYNPNAYKKAKQNFIAKNIKKAKAKEGCYGLSVKSKIGKDYIVDLNFCLEFALENRKRMLVKVAKEIFYYVKGEKEFELNDSFINRNHNHAELKNGLWIHRKGATHAEKGMTGVIPGNMRDGSFIVVGKGNPAALFSSSHGAGRVMSRKAAFSHISLSEFQKAMNGITAKVSESTKDESPFAYKDIFTVMKLQKDLVSVKHHLKPIINIKA